MELGCFTVIHSLNPEWFLLNLILNRSRLLPLFVYRHDSDQTKPLHFTQLKPLGLVFDLDSLQSNYVSD